MFFYVLYEKKLLSDLKLFNIPQVNYTFSSPDIIIHNDRISYDSIPDLNKCICYNKDCFIMKFYCGALQINKGKEIIYEICPGYDAESFTPFIVGWGMAIVLSQMDYSVFHCSALVHNDIGFFVSGVSGAGKSTTSLELIKKGCSFLADDLAIIDSYENMMILPAYPIQKVCHDIALNLDKDHLYSIPNDRGKYSYLNTTDYCSLPKPLKFFFQLSFSDEDFLEAKEITGVEKYFKIIENLYISLQYAESSLPGNERFQCLKIAGNVRFFLIKRPKGKNTLNEITEFIIKTLSE